MKQDFLDLGVRYSVVEGSPNVHLELFLAIEGCHNRQSDQTARVPRQSWTGPYLTPGETRNEILKILIKVSQIHQRTIDVRGAENLSASFHSLFKTISVVHFSPSIQFRRSIQ